MNDCNRDGKIINILIMENLSISICNCLNSMFFTLFFRWVFLMLFKIFDLTLEILEDTINLFFIASFADGFKTVNIVFKRWFGRGFCRSSQGYSSQSK